MKDDDRRKIAATLKSAEGAMLREIVREAESFLEAQLKVGLACDQRAMTFAGMLAAMLSILIGGTASMVAAKVPIWPHILSVLGLGIGVLGALIFALIAARPTEFYYAGNNPRMWIADIEGRLTLDQSLAGQAALYSRGIERNKEILANNHKWLGHAQGCALLGMLTGSAVEIFIVLTMVASGAISVR